MMICCFWFYGSTWDGHPTPKFTKHFSSEFFSKNSFADAALNLLGKKNRKGLSLGPGIKLTNHEIKYIMKAIRSLEYRGTLLKGKKLLQNY